MAVQGTGRIHFGAPWPTVVEAAAPAGQEAVLGNANAAWMTN